MGRSTVPVRSLTLVLIVVFSIGTAMAVSTGISGFSGNPETQSGATCDRDGCHAGGVTPTVTLSGPLSVQPLSTHTYTLTITGGQQVAGGLDVSVTDGSLTATQGRTQIVNGEVTHTAPHQADGSGNVNFQFDWTAPLSAGSVTLYGAGNSVNNGQGLNGDASDTDQLTITVGASSTPGETSGSGLPQMVVTAYNSGTSTVSLTYDTGCDTTDNNVYYGLLADVSIYGYGGQACNLGTGGSTDVVLPAGSMFFVIVGDDGTVEGSYGEDSDPLERPPSGACGLAQDLSTTCTQP